MNMKIHNYKVIVFAPDKWGQLERFRYFYDTTYLLDQNAQKALHGAVSHFYKARIFLHFAYQQAPKLSEDRDQLQKHGYTPAQRSHELAALIEAMLQDLYSSVDCARQVVTFIYHNHRGVTESTRKFFQAAAAGKVADTVPSEIRNGFAKADWYNDFRSLRDALTHSDVGSCHLDETSGKVSYMHAGLRTDDKALVINDIFNHVESLVDQVNTFMGTVFQYLNQTLRDEETWQMCCVSNGRVYSRLVRPSEAVDFNSGRCEAFKWFEKGDNPDCPFMGTCEAYTRRNTGQGGSANG